MNRIIGVTELQRKFRFVLDEVVEHRVQYVLTRGSRPEAVLVPYEQCLKFIQDDPAYVMARFDQLHARMTSANARYFEEEVEADLRQVTKAVRSRKKK